MPYRIIREPRFLRIHWYGTLVNEDLQRIFGELPRQSQELGYAPDVLHSFGEVEKMEIDPGALVRHSRDRVWTDLPNRARSAAVGDTTLTWGVALMFKNLNANPLIEMEVFATEEEALAWLSRPLGP